MGKNRGFVKRHALAIYFILAFALSWWPWPLVLLNPKSVAMIPWGPVIAALVVTALAAGRKGLKELLASIVRWRVSPVWYAAALGIPAAVAAAATYANVLLGARAPSAAELGDWYVLLPGFVSTLLLAGPLTEEPGWRGFALPRMQQSLSALASSLVLGVIWASWHLPLIITDPTGQRPLLQYYVMVVAQSVLLTWLYNNTRGSVLLAVLFHTAANVVGAFFLKMYIGTADYQLLWWIYAGMYAAVALTVVFVAGAARLTRREQAQQVAAAAEPA